MRRCGDAAAAAPAKLDQRSRKRRSLRRVGARAQLIKEHQRRSVALPYDLDNVFHMRGKGGKRLLNGLLVSDVRQHAIKDGNGAAMIGRDVQAALRHQGQQAKRFQRHGLAAGVRAGDDERIKIAPQPHTDGDDGPGINQRVPRADQFHGRVLADLRRHAAGAQGILSLGEDHIQSNQHFIAVADALPEGGRLGRQLRKNPLNLLLFADQQLTQGVVGVDCGHRLNEKCASRRGHVVDQAGNLGFILALNRNDIALPSKRNDRIAQVFCIGGRRDNLLQGFLDLCALDAHMAADVCKLAAGRIRNFLLGENGIGDFFFQIPVGRKLLKIHVQHALVAVAVVIRLDAADAAENARNAQQFSRRQAAATVGALQRGADLFHILKARRALERDHFAGRGGLIQKSTDVLCVRKRPEGAAALLRLLAGGAVRQALKDKVQLQLYH